ncbi:MAG: hypothetical protein ABIA93_07825 [Candidatus Woesearchaeota archaeon]
MTAKVDVTKEAYFRSIFERLLAASPNGTYATDLIKELGLKYTEVNEVVHYLKDCGVVRILYPDKDFYRFAGESPEYFLVQPFPEKLLSKYNDIYTFRGWIRRAKDYSFIISLITALVAAISLIVTLSHG